MRSVYEIKNKKITDNIKKLVYGKNNLPPEINNQIKVVMLKNENLIYLDEFLKELLDILITIPNNNEFVKEINFFKKQYNKTIKINFNNSLNLNLYDFLYNKKEILFENIELLYKKEIISNLFINIKEYLESIDNITTITKDFIKIKYKESNYKIDLNNGRLLITYLVSTNKNNENENENENKNNDSYSYSYSDNYNILYNTPCGKMSKRDILINIVLTIITKNNIKFMTNNYIYIAIVLSFHVIFILFSLFLPFRNKIIKLLFFSFLPIIIFFIVAFFLFIIYNLLIDYFVFFVFYFVYLLLLFILFFKFKLNKKGLIII